MSMIITEQLKKELAAVAREYDIALFVLFGSQAREDTHKKSDVDVAYSSQKPMLFQKENEMAIKLHEIFRTSHVDIVNLSIASPLLLKQITEKGKVLFEAKPSLFEELFLYANKVYRESAQLRELERDEVLRRIQQYKQELSYAR